MLDHMICMICFVLHICDNMQKLMVTVFWCRQVFSWSWGFVFRANVACLGLFLCIHNLHLQLIRAVLFFFLTLVFPINEL